jgi:hypothetical protein
MIQGTPILTPNTFQSKMTSSDQHLTINNELFDMFRSTVPGEEALDAALDGIYAGLEDGLNEAASHPDNLLGEWAGIYEMVQLTMEEAGVGTFVGGLNDAAYRLATEFMMFIAGDENKHLIYQVGRAAYYNPDCIWLERS